MTTTHEYSADCICDTCLEHGSFLADMHQIEDFERRMFGKEEAHEAPVDGLYLVQHA